VPDRSVVVTCGTSSAIAWLWDRHSGEKLASLDNGSDTLEYARFSPNGRLLAIINGFENGIYIWGVNGGADAIVPANARQVKLVGILDHESYPTDMSFSPDGSQLATVSIDRTLRIWNLADMKVKTSQTYEDTLRAAAFSPDGLWLAIGLDNANGSQLKLLNLTDANITRGFKPLKVMASINDVNFSPDGNLLVTAHNDGAITVWDVRAGEAVRTIDDVSGLAWRAAFNRDSTLLATLNFDHGVRIWGIGDSLALIPKPALAVRAQAFVTQALNMRAEAGTKAKRVMQLTTNTIVTIVDGPTTADDLTWWKIRTANGVEGWVAASVNGEETLAPDY
jgi:WD40 repeat protein